MLSGRFRSEIGFCIRCFTHPDNPIGPHGNGFGAVTAALYGSGIAIGRYQIGGLSEGDGGGEKEEKKCFLYMI